MIGFISVKMKKDLLSLALISLVVIILFSYYAKFIPIGHDYMFHLGNIFATQISLILPKVNIFAVQIEPIVLNNLGYGLHLFHPPLPHFLPAILAIVMSWLGGGLSFSLKLFQVLIALAAGWVMYFSAKQIIKSRSVALMAAIFYVTNPYFLAEFYIRTALSEALCFVFLPLLVLSMVDFLRNKYQSATILFITSFVGLFLSHLITVLYAAFFTFLILLITSKHWIKNGQAWKSLLVGFSMTLFLCAPLLVSLFEHRWSGHDYVIFNDPELHSPALAANSVLKVSDLFFYNGQSEIVHQINPIVCLCVLLVIIFYKKIIKSKYLTQNFYLIFGGLSILIIVMMCWSDFWFLLPKIFSFIQYPWRLGVFLNVCSSLLAATIFFLLSKKKKNRALILLVAISFSVGWSYYNLNLAKLSNLTDIDSTSATNLFATGSYHEYMTMNARDHREELLTRKTSGGGVLLMAAPAEATKSAQIEMITDEPPRLSLAVQLASAQPTLVELPRLYYLGYSLRFTDFQGETKQLPYWESDNGLVMTEIFTSGILEVNYAGTICYRASLIIAGSTLLLCLGYGGYQWLKLLSKKD